MMAIREIVHHLLEQERIAGCDPGALESAYGAIAADVAAQRARHSTSLILGICGSQGSGKSTLALMLSAFLRELHGLSVAILSIDDLYLSRVRRHQLAQTIHPLLETRGVPGTHDVELGVDVIRSLISAQPETVTQLPRFDKATDEPVIASSRPEFHGKADVVILEGWCVGAVPESDAALLQPINALERDFDSDGRWRRYVNQQLTSRYQDLFGLLDWLLMLRAPGFGVVFAWRREQEQKLSAEIDGAGNPAAAHSMSDQELKRFILHYERLSRHMLAEMPSRADIVVNLDNRRRILGIDRRQAVDNQSDLNEAHPKKRPKH